MSENQLTSYDEIPYGNSAFHYTHPDCLATVATLFGMQPPPVDRCRVLELGCARGGNLIPMAQALPHSRFLGIDLSRRQIASGQEVVDALGLPNIELKHLSILDVDDTFGPFDYILCHGVYSWVPAAVQEKILAIGARHLAPNGVAYVSYNTYPGWHVRGMVREMLGYHVRRVPEPHLRVERSRAFLDFLVQSVPDPTTAYARLLKGEADLLASETDFYLFHEHLEEVNQPVYFYQFAERAAARGLQYLGEARPSPWPGHLPPKVKTVLEQFAADRIEREQCLDFLCNGTFRRSLLCQDRVTLHRAPAAEAVRALHVTGAARPVAARPEIHSTAVAEFRAADNVATLSTNRPLVKAALIHLFEVWPRSVSFDALWAAVHSRLAQATEGMPVRGESDPRLLGEILLQCYQSGLVELHRHVTPFALGISERPVASPFARLQAKAGETRITNLRHRNVGLSEFDRLLLGYLDGSRDRAALLNALAERVKNGDLAIHQDGQPVQDAGRVKEMLGERLASSLHQLAGNAFLVG